MTGVSLITEFLLAYSTGSYCTSRLVRGKEEQEQVRWADERMRRGFNLRPRLFLCVQLSVTDVLSEGSPRRFFSCFLCSAVGGGQRAMDGAGRGGRVNDGARQ